MPTNIILTFNVINCFVSATFTHSLLYI